MITDISIMTVSIIKGYILLKLFGNLKKIHKYKLNFELLQQQISEEQDCESSRHCVIVIGNPAYLHDM